MFFATVISILSMIYANVDLEQTSASGCTVAKEVVVFNRQHKPDKIHKESKLAGSFHGKPR
jgi:hypothetical protein